MTIAFVASISIAALSTLADFIWATWIDQPTVVHGLVHGLVLFCAIGLVFGVLAGRPTAGAAGGAAIGAVGAFSYYVIAPFAGFSAMFLSWFVIWLALAVLFARLSARGAPGIVVLSRGLMAATASGLAFYSISGIWIPFDPQGWDYAVHFAAWTAAYFPGFAALITARRVTAP